MTAQHLLAAAQTCDRAFGFLVGELGYRRDPARYEHGGFALRYRGPVTGVVVAWYPRDTLKVWVVRLAGGEFPKGPDAGRNRFALEDVEALSGHARRVGPWQLHVVPNDETARLLAGNLRRYAADLLGGDLSRLPG
ncbi:hypothetical protein [Actinoplanes siamensis]|uniref:Uncharacterized protein n=1 Tax=Actinoplanes siamensis TaxID=1223317 RepID=A0A919TN32_9ACTN|nr:hypothetical protein [Actinoplanes siamensis]GIF08317.1 hypothetical protein Asi03nite_58550 [Actinoplanes siamensis]